jgi:hypothetical protein
LRLPRPAPSGGGTFPTSRPAARFVPSAPRISRGRRRRADPAGVSIDRVCEEPSGGAGVGHPGWGDGADVASLLSEEGCGPWRGVGP